MRIDLNPRTGETPDAGRPAKSAGRTSSRSAANEVFGKDETQLSFDQVRLHGLEAQANQVPEIRQERVAGLARSIHDGSYEASPENTAEAMVSEISARAALR